MHKNIKFSIVINTYNRAHTIENTLQSLSYLRYEAFEVIVVNGPSTDDTEKILHKYKNNLKILKCHEANLSKSRNIGIAASSGDVVCFIDDDAVPEPNWLCELRNGYIDNAVAAVGGYIRNNTGVEYQSRALVCDRYGNSVDYSRLQDAVIDSNVPPQKFYSLTGTNCSFRLSVLKEVGGFDEEFAYFLDETDLIIRIVDAGYKVKYIPSAEIHHKYAESHLRNAEKIPKSIYLPTRSKAYFCIKNAITYYSIKDIMRHLEKYRTDLRSAYDWYFNNGKIDKEHLERLHNEIDKGISDGLSDAYDLNGRKLLNPDLYTKFSLPYKNFNTILPKNLRRKICFLSQEYPPDICGGIGNWTYQLATELAKMGHEITVISKSKNHHRVDFEQGVWVHRIETKYDPDRTKPFLPDLAQPIKDYAYSVYDEVMRINVIRGLDFVSSPIWDLEGAALVSASEIPTLVSLHTTYQIALDSKPEWKNNVDYFNNHVRKIIDGEKWLLEECKLIVANSKAIVEDIESRYKLELQKSKIKYIPHGIEAIEKHVPSSSLYSGNTINVLFVGRFEKRKGVDIIFNILPQLMSKYENLIFNFAGDNQINFDVDGPILHRFNAKFSKEKWYSRLHFHGVVPIKTLNQLYSECDIFVAPSRYESFGLIFLEAMRFGKVSVGTNVGGIPEVISNGYNGLLVNSESEKELFDALVRLVDNPDQRKIMGENALINFNKYFTSEIMVKNFTDIQFAK